MKRDKDAGSENPQKNHKETSKKKTQEDFSLRNVALFSAGEGFICVMTDDRLGLGPTFRYSPPILKDHPWTLGDTHSTESRLPGQKEEPILFHNERWFCNLEERNRVYFSHVRSEN